MIRITKRLEFDAGHRIPDHASVCRNLHGHRYVLELTLEGEVDNETGAADKGMVLDFSKVKAIAKEFVADLWDHAFLVYEGDRDVVDFLAGLPEHKTVILSSVPTAENLARIAFDILQPRIDGLYGRRLRLQAVRLYETPNSWADYQAP